MLCMELPGVLRGNEANLHRAVIGIDEYQKYCYRPLCVYELEQLRILNENKETGTQMK